MTKKAQFTIFKNNFSKTAHARHQNLVKIPCVIHLKLSFKLYIKKCTPDGAHLIISEKIIPGKKYSSDKIKITILKFSGFFDHCSTSRGYPKKITPPL